SGARFGAISRENEGNRRRKRRLALTLIRAIAGAGPGDRRQRAGPDALRFDAGDVVLDTVASPASRYSASQSLPSTRPAAAVASEVDRSGLGASSGTLLMNAARTSDRPDAVSR